MVGIALCIALNLHHVLFVHYVQYVLLNASSVCYLKYAQHLQLGIARPKANDAIALKTSTMQLLSKYN